VHGAELDQSETPRRHAHPLLDEEHRSARIELDQQGHEGEQWGKDSQTDDRDQKADAATDRQVEAVVERVKEIAVEKGVTPSQVALAWVHAQGDDVFPIPGTKRRSYLEENVAAASIQLTGKELARLDEVFRPGVTAGDRYPDMSSVNA